MIEVQILESRKDKIEKRTNGRRLWAIIDRSEAVTASSLIHQIDENRNASSFSFLLSPLLLSFSFATD